MAATVLRLVDPVLPVERASPGPQPAPPKERPAGLRAETGAWLHFLLTEGVIGIHGFVRGLTLLDASRPNLTANLEAEGLAREDDLVRARADWHDLPAVDPLRELPDARLTDRIGVERCLRLGLLPWRRMAGATVILVDRPEGIARHRPTMEAAYGPVRFALSSRAGIEGAIQRSHGRALRRTAERRTAREDSCRSMGTAGPATLLAGALALGGAGLAWPVPVMALLTLLALFAMVASTALKAAALRAALRAPAPDPSPPLIAHLPTVSVIVALYREADIAGRLVRRLGRLDYPRDRIDILLAVEHDDRETRTALRGAGLPSWMRIIVVPPGTLRTKPCALNYALPFCRGSLIGVYDAEDAPDPGQIHAIVQRFHQRGANVACLQGVLDFYNPRRNWLSRCFTMEYAAWFRVILPGLDRLGLPVPLGGTTLFFRRDALVALGGWDAHNVTEDADLGIRLARRGLRTELIETVTTEEANCRTIPWIKQRSRWIKGYMMTWRVHMRDPRRLWRDLGPRGFIAFQVLFLGSLAHAVLAPVLLSFWLVTLGGPHPLALWLGPWTLFGLVGLFLLCEAVNLSIGVVALRRTAHRLSPLWLPTLGLYHPLASLAAWKALWELAHRPFYWDKTRHGQPGAD